MARVGSTDTGPELRLRRALWRSGRRYRVNHRIAGVRADVVFTRQRLAIFVDGCFWHGCPEHYHPPRSNLGFWAAKLRENVDRDRRQHATLRSEAWTALRFWEHEVAEDLDSVLRQIARALDGSPVQREQTQRVLAATETDKGLSRTLVSLKLPE